MAIVGRFAKPISLILMFPLYRHWNAGSHSGTKTTAQAFVRLPFGSGAVDDGPSIRQLYDGL